MPAQLKHFFSPALVRRWAASISAVGTAELSTRISLAVHTTRKPNPGSHRVDILVNGHAISAGLFNVLT